MHSPPPPPPQVKVVPACLLMDVIPCMLAELHHEAMQPAHHCYHQHGIRRVDVVTLPWDFHFN